MQAPQPSSTYPLYTSAAAQFSARSPEAIANALSAMRPFSAALNSPETFLNVLAACEALYTHEAHQLLVAEALDTLVLNGPFPQWTVWMTDEEFAAFFPPVEAMMQAMAAQSPGAAYRYANLYRIARLPHYDRDRSMELSAAAAASGNPRAKAMLAYLTHFGIGRDADPEAARRLMAEAAAEAPANAALYEAHIALNDEESNPEQTREAIAKAEAMCDTNDMLGGVMAVWGVYWFEQNEPEKGIAALERGAALKDDYACYLLGMRTLYGNGTAQDVERGLSLLQLSFERGHYEAALALGNYYKHNQEDEALKPLAEFWYRQAAKYGQATAQYELATMLIFPEEATPEQIAEGHELLDSLIAEGYAPAYIDKGYGYFYGKGVAQDFDQFKSYMGKAVESGNGYAAHLLASHYERGWEGQEADDAQALHWYEQGSVLGYRDAQDYAGYYHRTGRVGGEPDFEKAIAHYQQAAAQGSGFSSYELGLCAEHGAGCEASLDAALQHYSTAAELGYAPAYIKLGNHAEYGAEGRQPDEAKAFSYYQQAHEAGFPRGTYELGRCYRNATGVAQDTNKAIELLKAAAEAEIGEAFVDLGLIAEQGDESTGTAPDMKQAQEYFAIAANEPYEQPYAQYKLGIYLTYGYVEEDQVKGHEWLERAAENGFAHALPVLGNMHLYGYHESFEQDDAFGYYQRAAEVGLHSEGLGLCYRNGIGVAENDTAAFQAFLAGAEAGSTDAKYQLARGYTEGWGVKENPAEAYRWMKEAADEGNASASYRLGMMLLRGTGTPKNEPAAIATLEAAAEQGQRDAQYELGNCYLAGKGVPASDETAFEWFSKAAENGHEKAARLVGA